jgi:hypothetical protein
MGTLIADRTNRRVLVRLSLAMQNVIGGASAA